MFYKIPRITLILALCMVILSACGQSPAAPAATEAQPAAAVEPSATPQPSPTPTPEPIPCTIAFDSDRDGNQEIYRMAPDGSDLINLSNHPGEDTDPAWSPDGSQIAFVSNRENDSGGGQFIYIMNAGGSQVRQLTFENDSRWPDWSHDGSAITYTHGGDIYVIKADGSSPSVNLTNSPDEDSQSTWSPDGSKIAWLSRAQDGWNIFVMDPDGANPQKLTENGKVQSVQWSIDGQIFSIWEHPDGLCQKCVMNADGSNPQEAGGKGDLQRFLPFKTLEGDRVECVSGDFQTAHSEILLVGEIFPDIFLNLTNNPANDRNPDWPANCLAGFEGAAPAMQPVVSPDELVFGYAGHKDQQREREQDLALACNELGIQCVNGNIPELVAKGVDAIIQNTDHEPVEALKADLGLAKEKGIPVFVLDAEVDADGAYTISINYDHWAKTSLGWMLEKIGGKGQFAYFDLDPYHRYSDTIKDLVSRYPGITVVDFRDGKYDPTKIKPETSDFINMYPELKAIWISHDSWQAMGGLEQSGLPYQKWPVMNCEATGDALLLWQRAQAAYPDFDCFASVNPPGIAYDAVYAAFYLVSGHSIDPSALGGQFGRTLFVDLPTVSRDTYQEKLAEMVKKNLYYVDELMTPADILERWFLE